jgi:predicted transposase/invertase (TIGR01784 family)
MIHIPRDVLWKGIIEDLFEDFLMYFYPDWTEEYIDLNRKPQFLDKELAKIYPEGAKKKYADKLAKVFTKTGKEHWILIHIEVQGYEDENFAERMFVYFYRIRDRYQKDVTALAILTDSNPNYQPNAYVYQFHKTKNIYEFDTFKIFNKTEQELNLPNNPFSIVMLTAQKALEKRLSSSDESIFSWKKELVLALKEANYTATKIRKILDFIQMYVSFSSREIYEDFVNFTDQTFKTRKNMGIREAILNEVKEQGFEQGIKEGVEKGIKEGIEKGIKEGIEKGIKEGVEKGIKEGIKLSVKAMLQKGKFSLQEIAEILDLDVDFVKQVQKDTLNL